MQNQETSIIITEFKQFDIITSTDHHQPIITNHHFASSNESNISISARKNIMKEWKILQNNLPDSIFVRVYETRIDLLRAVIVGAQGTPYHDGLFFFDIQFPYDYPNEPPQVYYHSFGLPLNPNLYASGKVCLSLLNTWVGEKNEQWNPSQTTILQVLVSIQALVLNAKPYFNEPFLVFIPNWWGNWEKRSLAYNEETFLLNCKTMLNVIENPPSHFEEFVSKHFRDRAETILSACKAYVNGRAKIGDQIEGGSFSSSGGGGNAVSKKFKLTMDLVYSRLVVAFIKNGSSLEIFVKQYEGANMDDASDRRSCKYPKKDRVVNKKNGFAAKFCRKLKKILRLKSEEKIQIETP